MMNTNRRRGDSLIKKARECIAGGDAYEAREVLFRLMDKYPERADREVDLLMAACTEIDGNPCNAEDSTRMIIEESPDYVEAWEFLASLLSEMDGRLNELKKVVKHILEMKPGDVSAKSFLGYAYRQRERHMEAIEVFREMTDAFPDSRHFWDCLAYEQYDAGLYEESLQSWKKVLELEPDSLRATHWIEELTRKPGRASL